MALVDDFFKKRNSNNSTNVIKTICYGRVKEWKSREEAEKFFIECLLHSEGAEHERYLTILSKLKQGLTICSDD